MEVAIIHFTDIYVVHWAAIVSGICTEEIVLIFNSTISFKKYLKFDTRNVWISSVAENQLW